VFIGTKMTLMPWLHMPVEWSLATVGGIILASVLLSLITSRNKSPDEDRMRTP
jgi:tellurite resistance protein TerC